MRVRTFAVGTALAVTVAVGPVAAQSTGGWRHTILVYALGAGMSGEAAVRGVEADVKVSFSDILENLQVGGMLAWRSETDRWAVIGNAVFMGLGVTKDGSQNATTDADVDQLLLEIDGAYRFSNRFEVLFGARGNSINAAVEIRHPILGDTSADGRKSWVDPIVGARIAAPLGKNWSFVGRGDVGGFGLGSDLTWQANARFDWQVSKTVGMTLGYVVFDVDYEDGNGSDLFRYDMTTEGPFVGATFSF